MKKGAIYKCNTKDFYVKVLGMTDYIQNINEPNGSCPQYVLTQRMKIETNDRENRITYFVDDKDYNPAHWNIEYFEENFTVVELLDDSE